MPDTCVISCSYNFADYKRPKANLRRFCRQMERDGVPVFGIELYLEGQKPSSEGIHGWKQLEAPRHAILWQKEALWNACASLVPESFSKFIFLDADLWFDDASWLEKASEKLEEYQFIQPFSKCVWTDEDGSILQSGFSCPTLKQNGTNIAGHVGFGVGMTRDAFNAIGGFYEKSVIGNGDVITMTGLMGIELNDTQRECIGGSIDAQLLVREWQRNAVFVSDKKVGYIDATVYHEWHGSRKDRKYVDRGNIVKDFNPFKHVESTKYGYLVWSQNAPPRMMLETEEYFTQRNEDGKEL